VVAVAAGDERTGRRIARHRKIRGLTQRGLAMRANVAYGTLTKIESGHALPSAAVVAAIARVLSVNVTALTGQPFYEELRAAKVDQLIEPLRVALDSYDLSPPEDVAPRTLDAVERDVLDRCDEAMCGGLVGKAAAELPSLIEEVGVFAVSGDERAWRALASAYRCRAELGLSGLGRHRARPGDLGGHERRRSAGRGGTQPGTGVEPPSCRVL
jgi:transcriptional regulator with XRE-family HTH domain